MPDRFLLFPVVEVESPEIACAGIFFCYGKPELPETCTVVSCSIISNSVSNSDTPQQKNPVPGSSRKVSDIPFAGTAIPESLSVERVDEMLQAGPEPRVRVMYVRHDSGLMLR